MFRSRQLKDFLDLFFPPCCLACAGALVRGEEVVCSACRHDLPVTDYHLYPENPVEMRFAGRLQVARGMAFLKFRKNGIVQALLHQLKYGGHPEIGTLLGKLYGRLLAEAGLAAELDLIVPVPLHPARQALRGYNQSAMFASGLSMALEVEWRDGILCRREETETQTTKSKQERWENMRRVFEAAAGTISGQRILLVDDVITTGATIEACALPLIAAGCSSVSFACIAEAQ